MMKNTQLNTWLWKWHIVAGLISLPFMLLLAITGVIYLLKSDYNQYAYRDIVQVAPSDAEQLSISTQLSSAQAHTQQPIVGFVLPQQPNQATEFKVKGAGRNAPTVYVNPYTAEITGQLDDQQTLMFTVRKLHGELLLSKPGTLTIELVASWFIVLILTGIYVWWPKSGSGLAGLFSIRTQHSSRIFWRDCHAVIGFWLSVVMLAVVAGGMPWTDMFGGQLKWIQKQTNTGYPKNWRNSKGLHSVTSSQPPLSADQLVTLANSFELPGTVSITLPSTQNAVATISNRALWLDDQEVIHVDQYSGQIIKSYTWDDVGILMELRQIFMRFHQGEYGALNWWAMLTVGLLFIFSTSAGLMSYLYRKKKGSWSIPQAPKAFKVDKVIVIMVLCLGLLFPMFGISLLIIWLWEHSPHQAT